MCNLIQTATIFIENAFEYASMGAILSRNRCVRFVKPFLTAADECVGGTHVFQRDINVTFCTCMYLACMGTFMDLIMYADTTKVMPYSGIAMCEILVHTW